MINTIAASPKIWIPLWNPTSGFYGGREGPFQTSEVTKLIFPNQPFTKLTFLKSTFPKPTFPKSTFGGINFMR